jgi:hypothetical protein
MTTFVDAAGAPIELVPGATIVALAPTTAPVTVA